MFNDIVHDCGVHRNSSSVMLLFQKFNSAIDSAYRSGDDDTVNVLMVKKMNLLRMYHSSPWRAR